MNVYIFKGRPLCLPWYWVTAPLLGIHPFGRTHGYMLYNKILDHPCIRSQLWRLVSTGAVFLMSFNLQIGKSPGLHRLVRRLPTSRKLAIPSAM
jgi:hypothetical protein